MAFSGACHCAAVSFTVDADLPTKALSCNCSICRKKGLLLGFFPAAIVKVSGNTMTSYLFNTHKIEHRFCTVCGVQPFASGKNPDGSEMQAINLRCVPEIDLDALELQRYDGASK